MIGELSFISVAGSGVIWEVGGGVQQVESAVAVKAQHSCVRAQRSCAKKQCCMNYFWVFWIVVSWLRAKNAVSAQHADELGSKATNSLSAALLDLWRSLGAEPQRESSYFLPLDLRIASSPLECAWRDLGFTVLLLKG